MNDATWFLGIDVAKRKLDIALLVTDKIKSKVFDNNTSGHAALTRWLIERGAIQSHTHICLEATGPYSEALAIALVDAGWCVSVVNPARIKGFALPKGSWPATKQTGLMPLCWPVSVLPCALAFGRPRLASGESCAAGSIGCKHSRTCTSKRATD